MKFDVVLVDIMREVVASMQVPNLLEVETYHKINYQPGRASQIIHALHIDDSSIDNKGDKYPMVAMLLPVRELRGSGNYAKVKIDRLIIATLTQSTDDVATRYLEGGSFKSILYPCYNQFMLGLANSIHIIGQDPDAFEHTKMDNPGTQPVKGGVVTDYIDSIEILNLELTLNQIKTCKS